MCGDMMENIAKIMQEMDKISYGTVNKDGINIFDIVDGEEQFGKVYHLLSPQELLEKKIGVCWDQVELERKFFDEKKISNETYFIYIDDRKFLPSHTFLVFYNNSKVYWFEHSWGYEKGIHEYNDLNELLKDVRQKFVLSRKDEIEQNDGVYLYKYKKPKFNITCDEFYDYIYTQQQIYIYDVKPATFNDLERIKRYKYQTIVEYADSLNLEEKNKIKKYIDDNVKTLIDEYKNILYNKKIVGSYLVRKIDEGYLLDEIFIEKEYRNKGIGTSIIQKIIRKYNDRLYLWVYKANQKAIILYKKLGFIVIDETDTRFYMKIKK